MSSSIAEDVAAVAKLDVVPQILDVVCRITGMGFAAVARVTDSRWVACAVRDEIAFGLTPGSELEVETTICHEILQHGEAVLINDVALSPAFRTHATPKLYGFRSYISVPIIHRGQFFGTLCAIDPRPAQIDKLEVKGMFTLFADLIGQHLDSQRMLAETQEALLNERQGLELREQFIAVLGHDLRNPLAAIQGATRLLQKGALDQKGHILLGHVQSSVLRMAGLIDNLMDFARARLGGGFEITSRPDAALGAMILETVEELRLAHPNRTIVTKLQIDQLVACDLARMAQLLSNLLGNAITHGAEHSPVSVLATTHGQVFGLSVSNHGEPMTEEVRRSLFEPFSRAQFAGGTQGLGLGLYIASEIARAHGGRLDVTSEAGETCFTFEMPIA